MVFCSRNWRAVNSNTPMATKAVRAKCQEALNLMDGQARDASAVCKSQLKDTKI